MTDESEGNELHHAKDFKFQSYPLLDFCPEAFEGAIISDCSDQQRYCQNFQEVVKFKRRLK